MSDRPARTVRAFTLLELLVVIAIIALLIAILLPALGRARTTAVNVKCQSHLRSLHQSVALYANDFDGQIPLGYRGGRVQWNTMVYSGFGEGKFVLFGRLVLADLVPDSAAMYCPAETAPDQSHNTDENPWPPGTPGVNVQGGYASAPYLDWGFGELPQRMVRLYELDEDPSRSAMLADGVGLPERVDSRHETGVHALYADGAAAWVERARFDEPLSLCEGVDAANNDHQTLVWEAIHTR